MSLTDAFLLAPHRDRKEIWIALRGDGDRQRGSGTQEDPFSGDTVLTDQVTGDVTFDPMQVIVATFASYSGPNPVDIAMAGTRLANRFNGFRSIDSFLTGQMGFRFTLSASPLLELLAPYHPLRGISASVNLNNSYEPAGELLWPILTVTTEGPHGFADREVIRLANNPHPALNGDFLVFYLSPNSFAIWPQRVPKRPDDGKMGSTTCSRCRFLFDEVMRGAPAAPDALKDTAIHIGPGVFETRGVPGVVHEFFFSQYLNWRVRSGQRFLGAGMGATTLKLVGANIRNQKYAVFQTAASFQFLDGLEISDMTIDGNIDGQPIRSVAPAAITLASGGRHLRVRRVRAIHFGSQTEATDLTGPGYDNKRNIYQENFVFAAGAAAAIGQPEDINRNCVFEDCIAEWPGHNGHHNSFCFTIAGGESEFLDGVTYISRGGVIRNCYANMASRFGPCVPIATGTMYDEATGAVSITTRRPHGRTYPDNVLIQGVAANGKLQNLFNGVFEILCVPSETSLVYQGPKLPASVTLTGGVTGGLLSVRPVSVDAVAGIAKISGDSTNLRYRLTTLEPHYRTRNNMVRISGVVDQKPGPVGSTKPVDAFNTFNAAFAVDSYDSAKPCELEFTVLKPRDSEVLPLGLTGAEANVPSTGLGLEPGTAMVAEGNRLLHMTGGGPYQDTFTSRDIVARNNYYHDVATGPANARSRFSFWAGVTPLDSNYPLQRLSPGSTIAVATTKRPHGLLAADRVTIGGNAGPQSQFYGSFPIVVASANVFRFDTTLTLSGAEGDASVGYGIGRRPLECLMKTQISGTSKWRITGKMVIVDGSRKHGLQEGDIILMFRAGFWTETLSSKYNGYFRIVAATDDEFQFEMEDDPIYDSNSHGDTFSPGYFTKAWGPKRITYESNVIELHQRVVYPDNARVAIRTDGFGLPDGFFFMGPTIVRNNIIRRIDYDSPADSSYYGIHLWNCESALIQGNVIRFPGESDLIRYTISGKVRTSRNMTPAGDLILAKDTRSARVAPDPATEVEEAMILALLRR